MPELSPAGKWLRTCTRCGQTDDHPRHSIANLNPDVPNANFHMDCHALLGCPICLHQLTDADSAQGQELQDHLLTLEPLTDTKVAELLGVPAPVDNQAERRLERATAQAAQLDDEQRTELVKRITEGG